MSKKETSKKDLIDLHFHSCYSDGSENIASVINEAKARGVGVLALTDHNNGNGVPEFKKLCRKEGIAFFEGVEIYLRFPDADWSSASGTCGTVPDGVILGRSLNWVPFKEGYQKRLMQYWANYWVPATLESLKSVGFKVPTLSKKEIEEQLKDFGIPRVLHDAPKDRKNWPALLEIVRRKKPDITLEDVGKNPVEFANNHLYNLGMPAYVLRVFPEWSIVQAADLVEEMGGVLFAAHPGGNRAPWSKQHLDYFIQNGGRGLEVWQYWHTLTQIENLLSLAQENDLMVSGGSDWHGTHGHSTLGSWDKSSNQVPFWVYQQLLERLP